VIGTFQERTEDPRIEAGVKVLKVVVVGGPARPGAPGFQLARRCQRERTGTAADRFGRPSELTGRVVDRPESENATEPNIVIGCPASGVRRETKSPRACRDCRRRRGVSAAAICEQVRPFA
jgi:hypothetical protein